MTYNVFSWTLNPTQSEKNLLSSNISSTCPHNMVNFGPLAVEIRWRVWAPMQISTVSRLGSVTAQHSSIGRQLNFAALNSGRHLYSARRPSRWALAHISSSFVDLSAIYIVCFNCLFAWLLHLLPFSLLRL